MKHNGSLKKTPEYVEHIDDPDHSVFNASCLDVDGVHFCASDTILIGSDEHCIGILISREKKGLIERVTPEGARGLAAGLLRAAERLETKLQADATALLAGALAKKAPDQ
ncbi:hypothetical protein [Novosphingobium sp. FSW06-99]|uniref:hypothetical protein n=1 Tax=Novosphingobium sp. FSW06-99 TaxID=1739113 RepID=UPI00076D146D|nr:hypothetical protein [Novosphingobium sp. FSW06-99]KUR80936.1 hypothetical protein AQZ49_02620 [Novosphingobium sp. FSW06-99]